MNGEHGCKAEEGDQKVFPQDLHVILTTNNFGRIRSYFMDFMRQPSCRDAKHMLCALQMLNCRLFSPAHCCVLDTEERALVIFQKRIRWETLDEKLIVQVSGGYSRYVV